MELAGKAFKNYFNFKGRAGIREFILAHIVILLVNVLLLLILLLLAVLGNITAAFLGGAESSSAFLDFAQTFISYFLMLTVCLGIAAIDSRRLHDLNMTSLWLVAAIALLVLLNFYGFFVFATYLHLFFIVILLFPADKRANRYGPARVAILNKNEEDL